MESSAALAAEAEDSEEAAPAAAVCIRSAGGRESGMASRVEKASGCAVTVWRMDSAQQLMAVEVLAVDEAATAAEVGCRWEGPARVRLEE